MKAGTQTVQEVLHVGPAAHLEEEVAATQVRLQWEDSVLE